MNSALAIFPPTPPWHGGCRWLCKPCQASYWWCVLSLYRRHLDGTHCFRFMACSALFSRRLETNLPSHSRWFAHDRPDKAKEILVKYHGDGNPDSPMVALEMAEMQEVVSATGSDKRFWDFRDLFNSPGARYRTLLVVCVAWFSRD